MSRIAELARAPLSAAAMRQTMEQIMTGALPSEEIAEFLRALARRGETAEELAAAVQSLRAHAVRLPLSASLELCDTCGTGGDGQGTLNISTLAALVAASAGVRIAKHGNRAASSRCGSADLLQALGVNLDASPASVAKCIEELGFGFCFAPAFHPAMKAVAPIRKQLGIRTIFNLIGPLANPAPLTFQLVGVSEERLTRPVAEAMRALGIRHGMVVHGLDGMDEITTTRDTTFLELRGQAITSGLIDSEDLGLARATLEELQAGGPQENAQLAREVLSGSPSRHRDIVALNAGCAIYVADQAESLREGLAKANEALDAGAPLALLERVVELTET